MSIGKTEGRLVPHLWPSGCLSPGRPTLLPFRKPSDLAGILSGYNAREVLFQTWADRLLLQLLDAEYNKEFESRLGGRQRGFQFLDRSVQVG